MQCALMVVQPAYGSEIIGSIPEQVKFLLTSNFFVSDYRALVDAGLARTKCFLFVKTFFIWQNTLFKQIHIACRLGKIGHYRRLLANYSTLKETL